MEETSKKPACIRESWLISLGFVKEEKLVDEKTDAKFVTYTKGDVVLTAFRDFRSHDFIVPSHKCSHCGMSKPLHTPEEVLSLLKN